MGEKVGTKGQSQIKSFSDAAAAAKAELKLIAEKVKKGYVEQAKDNSFATFPNGNGLSQG
ncbi:WGR domain-containing protein [Escherichia coli]|nr:WGR domain-containing protein [Escherichia coli]